MRQRCPVVYSTLVLRGGNALQTEKDTVAGERKLVTTKMESWSAGAEYGLFFGWLLLLIPRITES